MINKKVGIMGGSFNPIHQGHLVVANEVLNIYNFDKIIFIPAGKPPHKNDLETTPWDRYMMTQIAILSNNRFVVSDIEVKRTGKSYTLDTMLQLREMYPDTEFYFITGTDAVIDIPNWHEPEKLLNLCKFIAVSRPGVDTGVIESKIKEIKDNFNGHIELMQVPMLQISSTDIRERIKNGISAKYLLPESVEQYIMKKNLYR